MTDQEGMGRMTVAQADGRRRFEYMEVMRRLDSAYLCCCCHVAGSVSSASGWRRTCCADDVGLDR